MTLRSALVGGTLCLLLGLSAAGVSAAETAPGSPVPPPAVVMLPEAAPAAEAGAPTVAPSDFPAPLIRPALAEVYLTHGRSRGGPRLTFPGCAATATAIRRMATGQVSAARNRCAHTVHEALGWGLGDAHQWLGLSKCGFRERTKEEGAQAGDIVVWPFTFGRRRSQHIGIAVQTDNGLRLLSNLTGGIELSALVPGYAAFYKPPAPEPPALAAAAASPQAPGESASD